MPSPHLTCIVADDVADTRAMYTRYLQYLGIRVVAAHDGDAALRAVRDEHPDVLVLDLAMPGMTGWEAMRRLRADVHTRDLPVVVVSGQSARDSALAAGATRYLEKPCLPDRLMAEIMSVLDRPAPRGPSH